MHVVTVEFDIRPELLDQFRQATLRQARNSLSLERECYRFDVCESSDNHQFFLYEIYASKAAFSLHLETNHFKEYDALVSSWVIEKRVKEYSLAENNYEQ